MNRMGLVLMLRPSGRSHHLLASCQRCKASSNELNRQPTVDYTAASGQHRPMGFGMGGTSRHFQSDSRTRSPVEALAKETSTPAKEFSEIPGLRTYPLVGNLIQLLMRKDYDNTRFHLMWRNLFEEYGPIIKLTLPGMPTFVASRNPDDLETIYKSTAANPMREAFESLKAIRDKEPNNYFNKKAGLLPENGDEWWRLRSRVQGPLLKPKNVAAYLPKVDKATLAYMDRIDLLQKETGQVPDDFLEDLYKWALECVGVVALNQELGCLDPDLKDDSVPMRLIRNINDMFQAMNDTELGSPFWKLYRTASYVKLETAHNDFLQIADQALQDAARSLDEAKAKGDHNRTLTVMEMFLNTDGLSKSDVATMILDMIFAGVDTTSHTLAFTLYALATNPGAQKKLQQEVDSVMGDSTELQPDHISQMVYLTNVVKESLRMYPLTVGNVRVLTEDIMMSGYKVPAGNIGFGFNWLICKDDKYFHRAKEFLPERWARDRPHGPIHPYASLPFSTGTRMCIGKRIAEQEIYTFLIRTMQRFSVTFESSEEMDVKSQLVLKPTIALPFKFHSRK